MNTGRITSCEARHGLDTFPIGDRHVLGLVRAVLPEALHPHRFLDQGFYAGLVVISLIFIRTLSLDATAPDAGNCRALRVVSHRNLRHAIGATVARCVRRARRSVRTTSGYGLANDPERKRSTHRLEVFSHHKR